MKKKLLFISFIFWFCGFVEAQVYDQGSSKIFQPNGIMEIAVSRGSTNNLILKIRLQVDGCCGTPIQVSQFVFRNLSTDTTIENAKIFSTGNAGNNNFSTSTQIGTTYNDVPHSLSTFTITTPPQTLLTGNNFFWLTFDVKSGAGLPSTTMDAECLEVVIDGVSRVFASPGPPQLRNIEGYLNYSAVDISQSNLPNTTTLGVNKEIMSINVKTFGTTGGPSVNLSSFNFMSSGNARTTDIENAKIWYTGTDPNFATDSLFGTIAAIPEALGTYTITGSPNISLAEGDNYFWLSYDVMPDALSDTIDVDLLSFVVDGVPHTAPAFDEENTYYTVIEGGMVVLSTFIGNSPDHDVTKGSTNRKVRLLRIRTYGELSPLKISEFNVLATCTTDPFLDIQSMKIFYSGANGDFDANSAILINAINEPALPDAAPDTEYIIVDTVTTGLSNMIEGKNNYWLVYDIKDEETPGAGTLDDHLLYGHLKSYIINADTFNFAFDCDYTGRKISPDMDYVSQFSGPSDACTGNDEQCAVFAGEQNKAIIKYKIRTTYSSTPLVLTSFSFKSDGTSDTNAISNANVYYTGNIDTLNTDSVSAINTQPYNPIPDPTVPFVIEANQAQALIEGDNYFWLTYDISTSSVPTYTDTSTRHNTVTYYRTWRKVHRYLHHPDDSNFVSENPFGPAIPDCGYTRTDTIASDTVHYLNGYSDVTHYYYTIISEDTLCYYFDHYGPQYDPEPIYGDTVYSINVEQSTNNFPNYTIHHSTVGASCSSFTFAGDTIDTNNSSIFSRSIYPGMYVKSTNVNQSNNDEVARGTIKNEILKIIVNTANPLPVLSITEFKFNTKGSSNVLQDIEKARVLSTGSSYIFNKNGDLFGMTTDFSDPNQEFVISSSPNFALAEGLNYFWLVYDIKSDANRNDSVDAELIYVKIKDPVTLEESQYSPIPSGPTPGRRLIEPEMKYQSCSAENVNSIENNAPRGSTNFNVLRVKVITKHSVSPLDATQLKFNLQGSSNPALDITKAKVFFTGSSETFHTLTQFGSDVVNPSADITFIDSQLLVEGDNYFWLAYDVASDAGPGDTLDACFLEITLTDSIYEPASQGASCPINATPHQVNAMYLLEVVASQRQTENNVGLIPKTAPKGSVNNPIIRLDIITKFNLEPLSISNMTFNAKGTDNPEANINNVRLYSLPSINAVTAISPTLHPTSVVSQFGDSISSVTHEEFTFEDNLTLNENHNIFFLTYDIDSGATAFDSIDARFISAKIGVDSIVRPDVNIFGDATSLGFSLVDANMELVSDTTIQTKIDVNIPRGTKKNEILNIQLNTANGSFPLLANSFTFNTNGSDSANIDIDTARVYFTGASSVFSSNAMFGFIESPDGAYIINGEQELLVGVNNFWLAYDISNIAKANNKIDAECTDFSIIGFNDTTSYTPSNSDPVGNRPIEAMHYASSSATQPLNSSVLKGSIDNEIVNIKVYMVDTTDALSMLNFTFVTSGSTSPASDISKASIYFTGSSIVFNNDVKLGETSTIGDTISIVCAPESMAKGNNYFWLTYDIDVAAGDSNYVDAECIEFMLRNGEVHQPDINLPDANRVIEPDMKYISSNIIQGVDPVLNKGNLNSEILSIAITTKYEANPLIIDSLLFSTVGTDDPAININNARVFYTGVSPVFNSNGTPFGIELDPSGAFIITGSQTLQKGLNYFWLTYDIISSAATDAKVDAECNKIYINGISEKTPDNPSPLGHSTIESDMIFVSAITTQKPIAVFPSSNNAHVIGIEVNTQYHTSPLSIDKFIFNDSGTTNLAIANNARVFYTGTNPIFDAVNLYNLSGTPVSPLPNPQGPFTVEGSQTLAEGTNYFWLTYDVNASASINDTIDAECDSVIISGVPQTPNITNPGSGIKISDCSGFMTVKSGNWATSSCWCGNQKPSSTDSVVITKGYTTIVNGIFQVKELNLEGNLSFPESNYGYGLQVEKLNVLPSGDIKGDNGGFIEATTMNFNNNTISSDSVFFRFGGPGLANYSITGEVNLPYLEEYDRDEGFKNFGNITVRKKFSGVLNQQINATFRIDGLFEPRHFTIDFSSKPNTFVFGSSSLQAIDKHYSFHHLRISGTGVKDASNTNLTVRGNLTISPGNTLNAGNSLYLSGNWINNGGLFNPNNSAVTFTGGSTSNSQTVFNSSGKENFNTILILNSLTLLSDIEVESLNLNGGILELNSKSLFIKNPNSDGIVSILNGSIKAETDGGDYGKINWFLGSNPSSDRQIPFINSKGEKFVLNYSGDSGIESSVGSGWVSISTFGTGPSVSPNNRPFPDGVNNLNTFQGTENANEVLDRYWMLDIEGYIQNPIINISSTYPDSDWDTSSSSFNSIKEENLRPQLWNGSSWDQPLLENLISTSTSTIWTMSSAMVSSVGNDTSICKFTSAQLNAAGGESYSWSPSTSLTSSTVANPLANPESTTTYTVVVSKEYGSSTLTETETITIDVKPVPSAVVTENVSICLGNSTTLTAHGGDTYIWTPEIRLIGTQGPSIVVNPTLTTTYTVTSNNDDGCLNTASETVLITVTPLLADAGLFTKICDGDQALLNGLSEGALSYNWQPSSSLSCNTCLNPKASPTSTTKYTFTAYNNNCVATDTVTVKVTPLPPIPSITQSENNLASSSSAFYQWYIDNILIGDATSQLFPVSFSGNYKVKTSDHYGCSSTSDFFHIEYVDNTGIEQFRLAPSLILFPNPNQGVFAIYLSTFNSSGSPSSPIGLAVEVSNYLGQIVHTESWPEKNFDKKDNAIHMDLSHLDKGVYQVKVNYSINAPSGSKEGYRTMKSIIIK